MITRENLRVSIREDQEEEEDIESDKFKKRRIGKNLKCKEQLKMIMKIGG